MITRRTSFPSLLFGLGVFVTGFALGGFLARGELRTEVMVFGLLAIVVGMKLGRK